MKTTQTWKIGDSLKLMRDMESETIDLGITSPPYNYGGFNRDGVISSYGVCKDALPEYEYKEWTREYLSEIYRILKPTGTFYLNMKGKWRDYEFQHPFWVVAMSQLKLLNVIIWKFPAGADVAKIKWYPRHEYIFMFVKTNDYYFNEQLAKVGDVWDITHVTYMSKEKTSHPAQFPLRLVERLIKGSSKEGDLVLDPFLGSGTMLEACRNTNRNCIGYEIDPQWENIYRERSKVDTPPLMSYFGDKGDNR